MFRKTLFVTLAFTFVVLGIPQNAGAQGSSLENILKGSNITYKSLAGTGFVCEFTSNNQKVIMVARERMMGPAQNKVPFAHITWTIPLGQINKVPEGVYEKLNDLDNNDILGNITVVQGKTGPFISGDYVFPLVEGANSQVMNIYLGSALRDYIEAKRIMAPTGN